MDLTRSTKEIANQYLKENHWSLDHALNDYYDKFDFTHHPIFFRYDPNLIAIFQIYSESGNSNENIIGIDGLISYIEDLGYQLEDLATLCLEKVLESKSILGGITRDQFLKAWTNLGVTSLLQMKHHLKDLDAKLRNDKKYFTEIYNYTFNLILVHGDKKLPLSVAIDYWVLFFQDNSCAITINKSQFKSWLIFLRSQPSNFTVSRDTWCMFLNFIIKFPDDQTLRDNYNEMDAWPLIIDEYYRYLIND